MTVADISSLSISIADSTPIQHHSTIKILKLQLLNTHINQIRILDLILLLQILKHLIVVDHHLVQNIIIIMILQQIIPTQIDQIIILILDHKILLHHLITEITIIIMITVRIEMNLVVDHHNLSFLQINGYRIQILDQERK